MSTPKETAYDQYISPLVQQIIALCTEHKINMLAQFALDHDSLGDPLMCTTVLGDVDPDDESGSRHMKRLILAMKPSREFLLAITGGPKGEFS